MCQIELGRKAHISEVAGGGELEHGLQQPRNAGGRRTDPGTLPAKSSLSVDEGDPVPSFDLSFTAPTRLPQATPAGNNTSFDNCISGAK